MKQNTITALKKVIEEMVSKEVSKQIKYVIDEIKNTIDSAEHYTDPETENNPSHTRQLTADPTLNKILNETQGGIPQDGSQPRPGFEDYPTMGDGVINTQEQFFQQTGKAPVGNMGAQDNMPEFMKKAMSGHSAKVVKAAEEKKNGIRTK